jgi:hypothetical protein
MASQKSAVALNQGIMKNPLLAIPLLVFLFNPVSQADTVTLTGGEKIEGKITAETPADITITVKTATITDDRTIARAEIQSIDKTTPDEAAFAEIKDLKPDPVSPQADAIDTAVASLKSFLEKFPDSKHSADVKASIDIFQKEKEHLDAGEVKFEGKWISKNEADKRQVQIQGQSLFAAMSAQNAAGDPVGALNTFDQLEKTAGTTRAYPRAVELAKTILPALSQSVDRNLDRLKIETATWEKNAATVLTPEQKAQALAAQKAEQAGYDATLAANKLKWPPLLTRSEKALLAIRTIILTEKTRLIAIPLGQMKDSVDKTDKAREALAAKDSAAADSLLKESLALWPANEDATYLQKSVTEAAAEDLKKATAAASAAAAKVSAAKEAVVAQQAQAEAQKPAQEAADTPWYLTIKGALMMLGGAVVILVVATVVSKARKPKNEVQE